MHPNMTANACVVRRIRLFIVHANCFSHNRAEFEMIDSGRAWFFFTVNEMML